MKRFPAPVTAQDFQKENRKASPGYYSVKLNESQVTAELTATARAGFYRYTFPESSKASILIDLSHTLQMNPTEPSTPAVEDRSKENFHKEGCYEEGSENNRCREEDRSKKVGNRAGGPLRARKIRSAAR